MGGNNSKSSGAESKPEDMQIDITQYKTLTQKEKKKKQEKGWCLYCGKSKEYNGANCPKKRRKSSFAKSAIPKDVLENEITQSH